MTNDPLHSRVELLQPLAARASIVEILKVGKAGFGEGGASGQRIALLRELKRERHPEGVKQRKILRRLLISRALQARHTSLQCSKIIAFHVLPCAGLDSRAMTEPAGASSSSRGGRP